eukprot:742253-Rhodomonas_salina.1
MGKTKESSLTGESYPTGEWYLKGSHLRWGSQTPAHTDTQLLSAERELSCEGEHPLTGGEDADDRVIHV